MSAHLSPLPLPQGVTERQVDCTSTVGLNFHILEAGRGNGKPLILLLHGYPELAFSWRKIMPGLAAQGDGNHVVAVDQRGYGRTTGWDTGSFADVDLGTFSMTGLVRDLVTLVNALGHHSVKCVIGHDFGGTSAAMSALMRPDFFRACVMMSHPFKGSPSLPFNTANDAEADGAEESKDQLDIHKELAQLPNPRKHYKWYNSTPPAANDWSTPAQGLQSFLRGYIHLKSANWSNNNPKPLKSWTAPELAKMPHYYIMPLRASMPETVAENMENEDASATLAWMPDKDLAVYVQEWTRTGFQGALNWYRVTTDPTLMRDVLLFAGKKLECPSTFITGSQDWGNYQEPGVLEKFPETCSDFRGISFVEGAGHWPQQEQPEKVVEYVNAFLQGLESNR